MRIVLPDTERFAEKDACFALMNQTAICKDCYY